MSEGAATTFAPSLREAHRALVARVLRVESDAWSNVLDAFHSRVMLAADIDQRLRLLGEMVAARFPGTRAFDGALASTSCPACGSDHVRARYRRDVGLAGGASTSFTYGSCERCGHGILLDGTVDTAVYASPTYYETQGGDGVGYPGYETERHYREAKGEHLARWAIAHAFEPPRSLLEIGSGFGFTRAGAERLGLRTSGVDLNPAATRAARRLYGMQTVTGTLADAMDAGALTEGEADIVLYDFVLEHIADPVSELTRAARMLSPAGVLVLRIPSMEALELIPFGSLYRSFRSDHLHLFTRASLDQMLQRAGLAITALETGCGADLLREVLTESEIRETYARGLGPDLTVCAMKAPHAVPPRHHS